MATIIKPGAVGLFRHVACSRVMAAGRSGIYSLGIAIRLCAVAQLPFIGFLAICVMWLTYVFAGPIYATSFAGAADFFRHLLRHTQT